MSATQTESRNESKDLRPEIQDLKKAVNEPGDVRREIQDLKMAFEVQTATQAGANATQAATHAGTWSTILAGGAGLVVGMFLALAVTATNRS
jgi:hypothetical protein